MKTTFKKLLSNLIVGKQVLIHKYHSNSFNHTVYSSLREEKQVLDYSYQGSEYATIVGVGLGMGDVEQIVLDLDENSPVEWISSYFEDVIEFKKEDTTCF